MDEVKFAKLFKEQLIPNVPANVIVMEKRHYHSIKLIEYIQILTENKL